LPSFGFFTSAIVARRSTGGGPTIFGSTDFSFLIYFRASIIVGVESETSDVAHGKNKEREPRGRLTSHDAPARCWRRRARAVVIGSTGCGALNFGGTHHKQPKPRRSLQPAVGEIIKPALRL